MGNFSAMLLILVFLVIGITLAILFLAVLRETLFWYWRSKGVTHEPADLLQGPHETALIIRKSIEGMKAGQAPGAHVNAAKQKPAAPAPSDRDRAPAP